MAAKKIIVVGCGFAGLTCALKLAKVKNIEVLLFDQRSENNFLPMLPDIIGGKVLPLYLKFNLGLLNKGNTRFINRKVERVDFAARKLYAGSETFAYDYLVLAAGAQTNFYGNETIKTYALKLFSVQDALAILEAVKAPKIKSVIVVGGGYTGVELAASLKYFFDKAGLTRQVVVVERANSLLPGFSEYEKDYIQSNLCIMGIEARLNTELASITQDTVSLKDGKIYDKSVLIWSAGVKAVDLDISGEVKYDNQARLKVDGYLRLRDDVFCLGDMACVTTEKGNLRMGVQFAVAQGRLCAKNIINLINHRPLQVYKPVDLGYIVPMANNKSCGKVLGVKVTGFAGILCHYFMCVWRAFSLTNKVGIIKAVIFR